VSTATRSRLDTVSADVVIGLLRAHEPELREAGIQHLSLFGSVARGEANADSDVDLAAELRPEAGTGLLRLAALERRLGESLGCTVDLLAEPEEKPRLRARIDRDRQRAF
jgi:predicted nucleotidyltransferase